MEEEEILIAKRLRILRSAMGLNQSEFADLLDVAQSNYSRTENGFQSLSWPMFKNLVFHKVKVNESWLLHGEGEMFKSDAPLTFTKFANVKIEDKGTYVFLSIKVPKEGGKDATK